MPVSTDLPGKLDFRWYSRNDHTIALTFPGSLAGRTFEVRLDGQDTPITVSVVSATATFTVPALDATARQTQQQAWSFVETTGADSTLIGGTIKWGLSYDDEGDEDAFTVVVNEADAVTVSVSGSVALAAEAATRAAADTALDAAKAEADASNVSGNAAAWRTAISAQEAGTTVRLDMTAPNVVFEGDSMSLSSKSWYPEIATEGMVGATKHNFGRSGESILEMLADTTDVDGAVDPSTVNVLFFLGGVNDAADGANAATIYSRIVQYCTDRKAAGYDYVIVGTILPSTLFSYVPADFETIRTTVNASIRAESTGLFDAIADIGADALIGTTASTADTTYYSDLLHPTAFGAGIMAHYFREAAQGLGFRFAELGTLLLSGYKTDGNVRFGAKAMPDARTGVRNTAIGISALETNQSGDDNVAVGYEALFTDGSGGFNVAVGVQALYSNINGAVNTAVGWQAMYANTTGSAVVAVGYKALAANTSGGNNTAVGYQAMQKNTTGANNAALGLVALEENTTGSFNTAVGASALQKNTTGTHNTAVGYQALNLVTTGSDNVAVGYKAMAVSASTAHDNVAVGSNVLLVNTIGYQNVAVGSSAMAANLTGHENVAIGDNALAAADTNNNVAVGARSLQHATSAFNAAVGYESLQALLAGQHNTAVGSPALHIVTSGSDNTGAGYNVLGLTNTGSRQTGLGSGAGQSTSTQRNDITVIGYNAKADGDYATALGSGTSAGAAGSVALGTDNAGTGASTTTANKIKLGTALHTVDILGGRLMLGDAPSTPGTPTAGGVMYVEAGVLKYKGSSGTVTLLAVA